MARDKKQLREAFRLNVFERDKYKCVICGTKGTAETLDAHHITDRNLMRFGGYVKENGITLCAPCHEKAEEFHRTGTAAPGMSPDDLYARIKSSLKQAQRVEFIAECARHPIIDRFTPMIDIEVKVTPEIQALWPRKPK